MTIGQRSTCLAVLLSGLTAASAFGANDFNMNVTTDGIRLGTHVMGPQPALADLKGKVVLVEFWGIH